jgi:hypothetical protein
MSDMAIYRQLTEPSSPGVSTFGSAFLLHTPDGHTVLGFKSVQF